MTDNSYRSTLGRTLFKLSRFPRQDKIKGNLGHGTTVTLSITVNKRIRGND